MSETSVPFGAGLFSPKSLAGHWRARRHIEDAKAGGTAYLSGVAVFSEDGPGQMVYRENGRLFMPNGHVFEASRTYRWRFLSDVRIEVLFEDGRLFHEIDLTTLGTEIVHLCDPDTYRGYYAIEGDQKWSTHWAVTGPRKDQKLITQYARV